MKENIGALDGVIRLILGMAFIAYAIFAGPWWIAFFAIIPIVTAALFYCPLYDIMNVSTYH
jgi:hypothetical protein